ncbi:hypothetical protein [Streptomyces sp. XD-27]|uniref:hypothetical protein n=1 Tax=Streptomyces sp. XD-27 TaxID=3062779 RepID=UPI0026F46508|nr:hypothetical protein [Streptomyces sp. XD-27]WKX72132.1 hypothetical protein Q3Y56_21495 [Streptomyces sp. XD-27]
MSKVLGAGAAAVACVALAGSPASAGTNTAHARSMGHHGCSFNSEGWFVADGDTLYIKDTCAEGDDAMLKVDVAPMKSEEWNYDHLIRNSGGKGSTKVENGFNFPEGKKICISVGSAKGREMGGFGPWKCGTT